MKLIRCVLCFVFLSTLACAASAAQGLTLGGHLKLSHTSIEFPGDSFYSQSFDDTELSAIDLRGNMRFKRAAWDVEINYQLSGLLANTDGFLGTDNVLPFGGTTLQDNNRHLFDLSSQNLKGDYSITHRLDRLSVGYTTEAMVIRLGRQAVSWGNGLAYNPMDIFNPFDPSAVDTEYKAGDDMLYAQWLLDSGNDWQMVLVPRRNTSAGNLDQAASSFALKYHAFTEAREYDLLIAQHYDEPVLGVGVVSHLGEAITRADLTITKTDSAWETSAVASLSYSWVLGGRNWSGSAEFYYNGFGISDDQLSLQQVQSDAALTDRFNRGELYSLGKYYAAIIASVELTPRFRLNPIVFWNLRDQSTLLQLSANLDWLQNADILLSANLPLGSDGSEFGGISLTEAQQSFLKTDYQLFAQVAFYF